jgi:hypothetical protein
MRSPDNLRCRGFSNATIQQHIVRGFVSILGSKGG